MILTVFRSRLRADAEGYVDVAREMESLARQMPGFVSFKTFAHADGERCSVAEFADWESHNAWAKHPRHLKAQHQGRGEFYLEYSIRVGEVAHAQDFPREDIMTFDSNHLKKLYDDFNARDIEPLLAQLTPDVRWANGMEGGFVEGRDKVRAYWLQQFETLRPHLAVLSLETDERGRAVFEVHQTVRDFDGALLTEQDVTHQFTLRDGQIALFEIVENTDAD